MKHYHDRAFFASLRAKRRTLDDKSQPASAQPMKKRLEEAECRQQAVSPEQSATIQ